MPIANARLVYVADPMCSWCWGFAPEFQQLRDRYAGSWEVSLLMGGLRPGTTAPMDGKMRDFLRHHWEEVAQRSGQPFAYGLLDQEAFIYDTEPAARAVVLTKQLAPDKVWDMFKSIQYAFYAENRDTNDPETYLILADQLGIDRTLFQERWDRQETRKATWEEFSLAREIGVNGFPSVLLFTDERGYQLSRGYATFTELEARIAQIGQNV
jgi:putative protein-disulfide isomerase